MRLKLINSNIFKVPGNPHMIHLGTIKKGLQEFIVILCIGGPKKGQVYIEEVVLNTVDFSKDIFANCKFIADDNLAQELADFAQEKGILNIKEKFPEIYRCQMT